MKIRRFRREDSEDASKLILQIFKEDNSVGVSQEGIGFFRKNHTPKHIMEAWPQTYVLIVENKNKIIAVARAKKDGWNTHLFVDRKYRKRGIAVQLDEMMEKWHREIGTRLIKLNSSPYALSFYEKRDYKKKGEMSYYQDIPIYYLEKELS